MAEPHILIIPPWFDINFKYHFAKSYHRWAKDLAEMDQIKVGLLYGEFHTGFRRKLCFEKKDLNYHYLGVRGWGLPKTGPGWTIWEKQYLKAFNEYVIRHGCPTVIHGFSLLGLIAAGIINKQHQIPFAYTEVLGSFITGTVVKRLVRKAGSCINRASLVCGISPDMVTALKTTFEVSVKEIPLYINKAAFFPKKHQSGSPAFISIGAPAQTKGLDILIKAMALLIADLPEAQLTIVDDIPERKWLDTLIQTHSLENCMLFTGAVPHEKIPRLIHQSHVLISASRYESFGYTMAEALSCGRPVVASHNSGSTYIVQKGMGKIVPQEDPGALADAMIEVYQNIKRYDPFQLHQQVQSRFGKEQILGEWLNHYRTLSSKSTIG